MKSKILNHSDLWEGQLVRIVTFSLILAIASFALAHIASAASVNIKSKAAIGNYLVDEKGMALYLFKKDSPNKSACKADNGCTERWPIFYVEKIDPAPGLIAADFGTITREDGKMQSTYKGRPLYYYAKDKDGDDVYGQGFNNVWFIVAP